MSDNYQIPVFNTIATAWHHVKGAKSSFWAAILLTFIIMLGIGILIGLADLISYPLSVLMKTIGQVVNTLLGIGLLYMGIERAFNRPIHYQQMFHAFDGILFLRLVGVYLLIFLCLLPFVVIGIIGAVVPSTILSIILYIIGGLGAFYVTFRLILSIGFALKTPENPVECLKLSFQGTRCNVARLFAIYVIEFLIGCLVPLTLGIFAIWAFPFFCIAYGVKFKRLLTNTNIQIADGEQQENKSTPATNTTDEKKDKSI